MGKQVLTVGVTYTDKAIDGVEIENLGLCTPSVSPERSAFPLYEYDTIVVNPASYSHLLFGQAGPHSNELDELRVLKRANVAYDIDSAFNRSEREREMATALGNGANVVWCLSEPKRQNFYGYRETHLGYAAPMLADLVKRSDLQVRKGRRLGRINPDSPFVTYFETVARSGWRLCLTNGVDGYESIASTPEGESLGGRISLGPIRGWLLTPPTSQEAANQLIRDAIGLEGTDATRDKYHGIFLSHTSADKPFVRRLRKDLLNHGVPRIWVDEAEIDIGDSLITKIEEGLKHSRYVGVVLSPRSIDAPWVKKELDVALNREIDGSEVVVLPLLYEKCKLPEFLKGKLYADFTDPAEYQSVLRRLLRRLRIK